MVSTLHFGSLAIFLVIAFLPAAIGAPFPPDDWFRALVKPVWQPPDWLFGPVWTALYGSLGVAGHLVWRTAPGPERRQALAGWGANLVVNAAWNPLFFGLHAPRAAVVVAGLIVLAVAGNAVLFWRVRPAAGALLLPLLAWVSFALVLNAAIVRLNY